MKVFMRNKTWIVLIGTIALFSLINVYFLWPLKSDIDSLDHVHHDDGHEAIHDRLGLSNEVLVKLPAGTRSKNNTLSWPYSTRNGTPRTMGGRSLRAGKLCPNLTISLPLKESQSFQPIEGTSTFVYSAYLVGDRVRIIVLRTNTDPRLFYCHVWTSSNTTIGNVASTSALFVTKGFVNTIPEDHGREYRAAYILCDIPSQLMGQSPIAVSVVLKDKCSAPSNWLAINLPKPQQFNFTVCVSALNRKFGNTHLFVEMVEFNKLLGAERFVFYNHSIHSDIEKIIHYYRDRGEVDVLQWPSSLPERAHYFGQLACLNDCLYRYKNRSRFLVFQDLDEFIIPTGDHYDWAQLINARLKHNQRFALFMARNVFFRKEWPKPKDRFSRNEAVKKYRSIVLGHTLREDKIFPYGHRSKYIINPKLVETVGIHDAWSRTGSVDKLDPNMALVYHYRDWENPSDTQRRVEDTFVVDKYGLALVDRLAQAWKSIREHTGLSWL